MRNAAETRTKLLETAITLIWRSSYHQVGVNEICRRAGVTKGAFYHHFESKADLFYAAGHHYWDSSKDAIDHIYDSSAAPLERLHRLIEAIIAKQEPKPFCEDIEVVGCPVITLGAHVGPEDAKVRQCSQELSVAGVECLIPLIKDLAAGGYLEQASDPEQVALLVHQYFVGAMTHAQIFQNAETLSRDLPEAMYRLVGLKEEFRRCVFEAAAE